MAGPVFKVNGRDENGRRNHELDERPKNLHTDQTMEQIRSRPVSSLSLESVGDERLEKVVLNTLEKEINSIGELAKLSREELLERFSFFGDETVDAIEDALLCCGLPLEYSEGKGKELMRVLLTNISDSASYEIPWSTRVSNRLADFGITKIFEIIQLSKHDFLSGLFSGIGEVSVREIEEEMARLGLSLGMKLDPAFLSVMKAQEILGFEEPEKEKEPPKRTDRNWDESRTVTLEVFDELSWQAKAFVGSEGIGTLSEFKERAPMLFSRFVERGDSEEKIANELGLTIGTMLPGGSKTEEARFSDRRNELGGSRKNARLPQIQSLDEKLSRPLTTLKLTSMDPQLRKVLLMALKSSNITTIGDVAIRKREDLQEMTSVLGDEPLQTLETELLCMGIPIDVPDPEIIKLIDTLSTRLWDLPFKNRAAYVVTSLDATWVFELVQQTKDDLLNIDGVGETSVSQIERILSDINLHLGMEIELALCREVFLRHGHSIITMGTLPSSAYFSPGFRGDIEDLVLMTESELLALSEEMTEENVENLSRKLDKRFGLRLGMKEDELAVSGLDFLSLMRRELDEWDGINESRCQEHPPTIEEIPVDESVLAMVEDARMEFDRLLDFVNPRRVRTIGKVLGLIFTKDN